MLENIDGKRYDYLPHQQQYERRLARLRPGLADEVTSVINGYCDGNRQVTAGWLFGEPGFAGKHQEMIADLNGVEDEVNQLLGQLLWEALRARPEVWHFYRPDGEGEIPPGMRYWRDDGGAGGRDGQN